MPHDARRKRPATNLARSFSHRVGQKSTFSGASIIEESIWFGRSGECPVGRGCLDFGQTTLEPDWHLRETVWQWTPVCPDLVFDRAVVGFERSPLDDVPGWAVDDFEPAWADSARVLGGVWEEPVRFFLPALEGTRVQTFRVGREVRKQREWLGENSLPGMEVAGERRPRSCQRFPEPLAPQRALRVEDTHRLRLLPPGCH